MLGDRGRSGGELRADAVVPVPRVHTVDGGESLAALAERHGVPVDHLFARNAHTPGLLQVGATVTATPSPTLQDLRRYDYDYTFSVRRAAQDTIATGYAQNTPPDPAGPAVAAAADGPRRPRRLPRPVRERSARRSSSTWR